MAEQVVVPITQLGTQATAVAGSQGASFTATDRQVIKERAGEVDLTKPFKEIFFKGGDFTHKVENEQSTINPEMDLRAMESRRKAHKRILKYSAITAPREHVDISGEAREEEVVMTPPEVNLSTNSVAAAPSPVTNEATQTSAAYDQVAAEQTELNSLISKIQELNFKRVLCDNEADFEKLSAEITLATLAGSQPEARSYLEAKIDAITKTTAEYKLRVLQALESIEYDENDKNVKWLRKMVTKYSKTAA